MKPEKTTVNTLIRPGADEQNKRMVRVFTDFHNRTVLFRIGNWIVATYGVFLGLAFALGFLVGTWHDGMTGQDPEVKLRFYLFVLMPSILIGSRAASVLLEWNELFRRPLKTLVKPGYMLHGGIFGAVAALIIYGRITGSSIPALLDTGAFAMPLGEAVARMGCYVYGCCWGRPTQSAFGTSYTSSDAKVIRCRPNLRGVKIHPTPLYGFATYLGMFALFCILLPHKQFDGMLAAIYLILHPITRLIMERYRNDDRGRLMGRFTHSQFYSFLMFVAGAGILIYGLNSGANRQVDISYRLVHVLSDVPLLARIVPIGIVAFLAFGIHYRKVGNWIGNHDSGGSRQVS
jgi:phosphatidylglycerol:prolipoprotein diacylglycerol transferase